MLRSYFVFALLLSSSLSAAASDIEAVCKTEIKQVVGATVITVMHEPGSEIAYMTIVDTGKTAQSSAGETLNEYHATKFYDADGNWLPGAEATVHVLKVPQYEQCWVMRISTTIR